MPAPEAWPDPSSPPTHYLTGMQSSLLCVVVVVFLGNSVPVLYVSLLLSVQVCLAVLDLNLLSLCL